jgi:hypothetical protein
MECSACVHELAGQAEHLDGQVHARDERARHLEEPVCHLASAGPHSFHRLLGPAHQPPGPGLDFFSTFLLEVSPVTPCCRVAGPVLLLPCPVGLNDIEQQLMILARVGRTRARNLVAHDAVVEMY